MTVLRSRSVEPPEDLAESLLRLMSQRRAMDGLVRQLRNISILSNYGDVVDTILEEASDEIEQASEAMNDAFNQVVSYFADQD